MENKIVGLDSRRGQKRIKNVRVQRRIVRCDRIGLGWSHKEGLESIETKRIKKEDSKELD